MNIENALYKFIIIIIVIILSFEESKKVVDSFKSDKSPGEDGFTRPFLILSVTTW